ncbi:ral GTPase-activating protein subunit alpha-1-like isoform X3 [Littorina saxatilis]|uniref:ral GTPase-activating protein subunit alpha-1-like isoform X3 n=1 Tax=Littorina saxatilis TaxID=31220 RepID=UPI0038B5C9F4
MSAALSMFRKTASHGDVKKSAQKVADTKKDSLTRLKHLRSVLDNYDIQEAKKFFQDNYSHIYYIFYDNFGSVEADLKQRASKAHREELEGILHIFEKILFLLPELVHKRWMFHSIGRILKKLLHPGNSLQLRRQGVRLFLVWYQILQDNASDECHRIFQLLVPGLGDGDLGELFSKNLSTPDTVPSQSGQQGRRRPTSSLPSQPSAAGRDSDVPRIDDSARHSVSCSSAVDVGISGMIAAGEITPILPSSSEKMPDNLTKYFLDHLLNYMVSEVIKIEWMNKEMREISFTFLFNKFKTKYLLWLLPDFHARDIYEPVLELPRERSEEEMQSKDEPVKVTECRDSFIIWLANFTITSRRPDPDLTKGLSCSALTDTPSGVGDDVRDGVEGRGDNQDLGGVGNKTGGSGESTTPDQDSIHSSQGDEHSVTEYEIVRAVLYSTRENVNIVHECFRQSLLFSFRHTPAIRKVIAVYKEWFQDSPSASALSLAQSNLLAEDRQRYRRNRSYLGAVADLADSGAAERIHDVRAGLQRVLQVFITNAANIFLLSTGDNTSLQEQVDLCKRVLNIYRHVVMNTQMNQRTWEQMLKVLLRVTSGVLKTVPPRERHRSLGGRLAQPIFQTLIVTWIKANLNVQISSELWDEFLEVLSSLTSWIELIKEWGKTMETLTRVLARQVYGLDLLDLPLERLSEQKEKRRRGKESTKMKSNTDRSFTRGWSRSDGQMVNTLRSSTNSAPTPETTPAFDRGKYKSDGGSRMRPDLTKQLSLSGEPSPAHSRCASSTSEILVRSSSEGNIADPRELIEKLRGASFVSDSNDNGCADQDVDNSALTACGDVASQTSATPTAVSLAGQGVEDPEVACITAVCTAELASLPGSDVMPGIADHHPNDHFYHARESCTPSPTSMHSARSKSGSRSPSPTEMISDSQPKDSPTPDRDSLHIDMVASNQDTSLSKADSLQENKSVMAGGTVPGWTPDVAVVLWQRMLCCLGDVNKIEDPDIHANVFDYLCDLLDTLFRMSENLGVTPDNMSSPSPSELIPPTYIFASWLFECLQLSNKFKRGKLRAYQLICLMMLRPHEVPPSRALLARFYNVLHAGLTCNDQDVPNVLVSNCGPRFFSVPLPGSVLLILDFINAAGTIISAVDYKEPPRAEAVSILGALLSFPNHFLEVPVLQSSLLTTAIIEADDLKDRIIDLLLKAGKREPAGLARCIAVSSIGIFLYGELLHNSQHPKMKEAINVLLGALMCVNKKVAKVATDILMMLCDHVDRLLDYHPHLPKKITEAIATTISSVIQSHDSTKSDEEKRLIVSMMFCMTEWCMRMPLPLLMETSDSERSCMYKVFRVLHSAVTGHSSSSLSRVSKSLADFMQDTDFTNIWDSHVPDRRPANGVAVDLAPESVRAPTVPVPKTETDIVKLAARSLMTHLVNHLGHFPMGLGAARLHTTVQEHHDLPEAEDLKADIFNAPNLQLFILNHRCLISFVELPAVDAPGGGVTAGLTTARTVCRIIVRDLSGKFCWENSVLYSPPWCTKESSRQNAEALLGMATGHELEPLVIQEESDVSQPAPSPRREASELPVFETTTEVDDNLDDVLRFIWETSPECLLQLGSPLNIPAPLPEALSSPAETNLTDMVQHQTEMELYYYSKHKADYSRVESWNMLAKPQMPTEIEDPVSPFQMCRMLLDQMGLLSWEKRCHFDLLKKSDKLLRELKNLDLQRCRETHKIAVIYVAEGQEDKNSILSNSGGSRDFEDFVAGLGWEIDLETHQGFLGGLQQNKTTGDTAPYYANSTCEVVFHVSTRIPCQGNDWHIKMRHLGNDEVHIVWSEHTRDYRRGIIPTEFGDVIIVIYPMHDGLFRIQINRKPEIPYFGPLFDGAVVDHLVLPGLVRATAINASRVKRSLMPFFHAFYEERAKCLESIIQQHTENSTFEEFAANVFAPVLPNNATTCWGEIFPWLSEDITAAKIKRRRAERAWRHSGLEVHRQILRDALLRVEQAITAAKVEHFHDPLPGFLFTKCLNKLLPSNTDIINISLATGVVPDCFKSAIVRPLIKKPGLDVNELKNYRPVSNLPFLSKLLERIILEQLSSHLSRNSLMPVYQSAYRPHHSTETALLRITTDLLNATDSGLVSALVLLDLSAAFNTIDHQLLVDRLSSTFGIHDTALSWFRNYLQNCSQTVTTDSFSSQPVPVRFGIPQGSVLGPVLFTLVTPLPGHRTPRLELQLLCR